MRRALADEKVAELDRRIAQLKAMRLTAPAGGHLCQAARGARVPVAARTEEDADAGGCDVR
jgi:hypothetical protein